MTELDELEALVATWRELEAEAEEARKAVIERSKQLAADGQASKLHLARVAGVSPYTMNAWIAGKWPSEERRKRERAA